MKARTIGIIPIEIFITNKLADIYYIHQGIGMSVSIFSQRIYCRQPLFHVFHRNTTTLIFVCHAILLNYSINYFLL